MKKLLFMVLVTLTSMTYAGDEGRFSMLEEVGREGRTTGILILDSEKGKLKYCIPDDYSRKEPKLFCSEWSEDS
jgi:hypothetical protein